MQVNRPMYCQAESEEENPCKACGATVENDMCQSVTGIKDPKKHTLGLTLILVPR